jgi:hypothetical protein
MTKIYIYSESYKTKYGWKIRGCPYLLVDKELILMLQHSKEELLKMGYSYREKGFPYFLIGTSDWDIAKDIENIHKKFLKKGNYEIYSMGGYNVTLLHKFKI